MQQCRDCGRDNAAHAQRQQKGVRADDKDVVAVYLTHHAIPKAAVKVKMELFGSVGKA